MSPGVGDVDSINNMVISPEYSMPFRFRSGRANMLI